MSDTLDSELIGFFDDPKGSQALVLAAKNISAAMVQGTPLTLAEALSGYAARVCLFIYDGSNSMAPAASALRDGFNQDFVPAVKAARGDDLSPLRFGAVVFSSGPPEQVWQDTDAAGNRVYFHTIDQLPQLTVNDYDPEHGYSTALHLAILHGTALALSHAAQLQQETGNNVDVDVIVLSDGANNRPPLDPSGVKQMVQASGNRVRFSAFFFETGAGLVDPVDYFVNDLGFDPENVQVFGMKSGETAEERDRRFRRMLSVMSKVTANRGVSVVAAAKLDDEELA